MSESGPVFDLLIRNATVVDGNGTPASGPKDILVEDNTIADVIALDPVALSRGGGRGGPAPDAVIDATGKYVLPGLIDAHAHLQEERGGKPQPIEYELDIWLACGITTVRDVGSDTRRALELRRQSAEGQIAAPRIFVYPMFGRPRDAQAAVARVRELKRMGADGIKILGIDRDTTERQAMETQAPGRRIGNFQEVNLGFTRDQAVLAGNNSDNPEVRYLPRDVDIKVGDRIVTSGVGGNFVRRKTGGVPVARGHPRQGGGRHTALADNSHDSPRDGRGPAALP